MPAFWLVVLIWEDWQQVVFPPFGGAVSWRDGMHCGLIPGDQVAAAMVDLNVQPGLHKGPGPTPYLRIWVADMKRAGTRGDDKWERVFGTVIDQSLEKEAGGQMGGDKLLLLLQTALQELGYPAEFEGQKMLRSDESTGPGSDPGLSEGARKPGTT